MKAKTWQRHILDSYRGVQDAKNQEESFSVLRHNAGVASRFEELAQALMGKTANHRFQCNQSRNRLQCSSAMRSCREELRGLIFFGALGARFGT
jgi:hypothetical protein